MFERTRLKKKHRKRVKQKRRSNKKSFTKRDEQMKKEFFQKNRGDFVFLKRFHQKKNTKQKKHERESINTWRRNMERTTAKRH